MNTINFNIKTYLKQEFIDLCLTLFKKFDKEGKGYVLPANLPIMLRLLEFNPTEREIKDMLDKLEEDPNIPKGQITREGFLSCVARKQRDNDSIEELIQCFKLFDPENKGVIEEKVIRYVLSKTGDCLSDLEMDNFMEGAVTFTTLVNDLKYIKYVEYALFLKDLYKPPPAEDPKKKKGKK